MLEIFGKAKKNLIDETWLLITLMEDEYELLLKTFVTKWKKISKVVMNVGSFQCPQNGLAWKDKWGTVLGDFKRISDHMSKIRQRLNKMMTIGH